MKTSYLRLKKRDKGYIPKQRPRISDDPEQLTGKVQTKRAAMGEERFAKMLYKRQLGFKFRSNPTGVPTGMPGWLELDFLVSTKFGHRAFEIDDMSFIHKGAREDAESMAKDLRRLDGLRNKGLDVMKIEHIPAADLNTQEMANNLGRELFG